MRMMSIASGSSGNCIYIGSDNHHILIDAGISRKRIMEGLEKIDLSIKDIDAILVTHEHADHIGGLGVISRKDNLPIYASNGTIKGIKASTSLGKMPDDIYVNVNANEDFIIGDLTIHPFRISHDANEPFAYTVSNNNKKMAVCTDLGMYDDYTISNLKNLDAILLEANHDVRMLQVGRYPYYLKQRILGNYGHLSNESSGRLLGELLHDDIKGILLGHLSQENNLEQLAYETVKVEIDLGDNIYKSNDFDIEVAKRDNYSKIIVA